MEIVSRNHLATKEETAISAGRVVYLLYNFIFLAIISLAFNNASIIVCCSPFIILSFLFIDRHFPTGKLILSETIVLICLLILYFGYISKYGSPYYLGGSDDLYFEKNAIYLIDNDLDTISKINNSVLRFDNSNGFLLLLSFLIRFCNFIGEYHTIIPRIINVYLLISTLFIYYRIGLLGKNNNNKSIVLLFLLLFPNYIYVTIHVFRDTLNFFLISLGFFFASLIKGKKNILMIVCSLAAISFIGYLCFIIRKPSLLLFAVMIVFYLIIGRIKRNMILKYLFLLFFLLVIFYFAGGFALLRKYTESYNNYLTKNNDGLSALVFNMPIFPIGIVFRLLYGLVFPIPLAILNFSSMFNDIDVFFNVVISIGSIFQIFLIPFLIKSFRSFRINHSLFLIVFIVISLTTFNFRQITLFYPFMFSCSINEFLETKPRKRSTILFGTGVACVFLILLYFSLKL